MEDDLQGLRDLIAQLQADNERLQQGQAGPSVPPSTPSAPSVVPSTPGPSVAERLIFVPRDRKCPIFRGRTSIGLSEWVEEIEASMRARRLSQSDQAFFLFDHLEGEAKDEIRYRSAAEREDPAKILAILKELYGGLESYISLQQAFFSRRQQEGETLQEFSLALRGLMEKVKPTCHDMPNAEAFMRD